jgi:hypothetical protein
MAAHLDHPRPEAGPLRSPVYPDDIRPRLQTILATLADMEFALERKLDSIRRSGDDEVKKRKFIALLRKRHEECRASYAQELADMQKRIEAMFC